MKRSLLAGALVLGTLAWSPPTIAQIIADGCTFDSETGVVTYLADEITLVRVGDALSLNGAVCDGATVTNTDLIQLFAQGPHPEATITIDLAGGPFAPGATHEKDDASEIEIEMYGAWTFTLLGTAQADHVVSGYAYPPNGCSNPGSFYFPAVNLDATEASLDADVFDCDNYFSVGLSSVVGAAGDDVLSIAGGEGFVEDNLDYRLTVLGGPGDDLIRLGLVDDALLRGGPGVDVVDASPVPFQFDPPSFTMLFTIGWGTINPPNTIHGLGVHAEVFGFERYIGTDFDDLFWGSARSETFLGGAGDDEIDGRAGDDEFGGQGGDDWVRGGLGDDDVGGGIGADVLLGSDGSDTVSGWTGADQLFGGSGDDFLRGGLDTDSCDGGAGFDQFGGCETRDTPNPG